MRSAYSRIPLSERRRAMEVLRDSCEALKPPPRISVAQWADEHRHLKSSSPIPGKWRTDRTPYLREIMECASPGSKFERTVFMKSAQVGGTEVMLNFTGFVMHHSPGPALLVQPSVEMAKRFSKQRLDQLIENSPILRDRVRNPRSRDSGNTILMKDFPGGTLILTGANSAVGLRSLPAKYLACDELDGWPLDADGEGDPFSLALARTIAYKATRKILAISTPTIEGFSRIAALYAESDQRRHFVPCPRCDHFQALVWERVRWEPGQPETAKYFCESCGAGIENHEKTGMLARGEWRATAAGDGRTAGFQISALYSPVGWPGWPDLARDFLAAKKSRDTLQVFVNTVLGEVWRDEVAVAVDADVLMSRREPYGAEVPGGAVVLTAGVDTQDDRLELEIVGWGANEESWSIAYHVLYGDPAQPEIWQRLDGILARQYKHESGLMLPISAVCIDSGGHHTEAVYQFTWPRIGRRVFAVKGISGFGRPIFPRKGTKGFSKAPLFLVGVDSAKERVYTRLKITTAGPGFCHFPLAPAYDRSYFVQLTAERISTRLRNGHPERIWVLPHGVRNEGLDCRVYALAGLHALYQGGVKLEEQCERMQAMVTGTPHPTSGYQTSKSKFLS